MNTTTPAKYPNLNPARHRDALVASEDVTPI